MAKHPRAPLGWRYTARNVSVSSKRQELHGDVVFDVDWPALARRLGHAAARNKSGTTRVASGLIRATFKPAK